MWFQYIRYTITNDLNSGQTIISIIFEGAGVSQSTYFSEIAVFWFEKMLYVIVNRCRMTVIRFHVKFEKVSCNYNGISYAFN